MITTEDLKAAAAAFTFKATRIRRTADSRYDRAASLSEVEGWRERAMARRLREKADRLDKLAKKFENEAERSTDA